jgi:cytochrome c
MCFGRLTVVMSGLVMELLLSGCSSVQSQAGPRVTDGHPQRGRVLVGWYGCASCHEIPDAPVTGRVGPPLRGIAGRSYLAGRLPNTPENMLRWIRHPEQVDELTVMPDTNVTAQDARDIAAFLYTLR